MGRSPEGPTGHQGALEYRPTLQGNQPLVCWGSGGERFPYLFSSGRVMLLLILA